METQSTKKNRMDSISINKIYETITDKGFIQELWLDVLSDMKEKPSYMRLKEMVAAVIENAVENYATKPKDHEERLKNRTIFTNLSIMTYTMDSLISDVLHKKLKDEFKSIIGNIVGELKIKKELSETEKQKNSLSILEGIGDILCNGMEAEGTNQTDGKHACLTSVEYSVDFPSSDSIGFSLIETVPDRSSRNNVNNKNMINAKSSYVPSSSRGSKSKSPGKRKKVKKNISKYSAILSSEENSDVNVTNVSNDDTSSSDESFSFRSISSVHTSDLSSFEDDISISSEDEKGVKVKKHVSLKLASYLYASGKLDDLHEVCGKKSNPKYSPKCTKPANDSYDSSNKRFSGRMRKPNSKYSSDDVICTIKQFPQVDSSPVSSPKKDTNMISNDGSKLKKGRPRKVIPYDIDRVSKIIGSPVRKSGFQFKEKSDTEKSPIPAHSSVSKDYMSLEPKIRGRPPKNKISEIQETMSHIKTKRNVPSEDRGALKENVKESMTNSFMPSMGDMSLQPKVRGRPPKNKNSEIQETMSHIKTKRNVPTEKNAEESISNNSLPGIEEKRKRGRPLKYSSAQTSINEDHKSLRTGLSNVIERLHQKQAIYQQSLKSSHPEQNSSNNEPELKRKRGRPLNDTSKSESNDDQFKHTIESFSRLEERLCLKEQKSLSLSSKPEQNSSNNEPEIKRKRGRPLNDTSKSMSSDDQFKHSAESFASLEERLCLKEPKPLSPQKSSTKSYETSDLYKPRSDFRGSFGSRGSSRAITLFSN